MKAPSSRDFWQTFLALGAVLAVPAFYQTMVQANKLQVSLLSSKWAALLAAFALNALCGLAVLWALRAGRMTGLIETLDRSSPGRWWRVAGIPLAGLAMAAFWFLRLNILGKLLPGIFPALWFFCWFSLAGAAALRLASPRSWAAAFATVVILQGVLFVVYGRLRLVSPDPFSLGYSEGGRFYYASLWFAKSLYGMQLDLSAYHPSRYLLQALPFLVKGLPIWAHRLWQALLWIGLTAASAHLLVRRLALKERGLILVLTGWLILFFFEGPVYYHLQICVIMVLAGCSDRHPNRTLIAVLAASAWAGISRINWFPVPAMLATSLYLLERPVSDLANWRSYIRRPLLWGVLGLLAAWLSQRAYGLWLSGAASANPLGSAGTSALLFYRLLPNPSFALGILPGIALVSLPLWVYLFIVLRRSKGSLHPVRLVGLGAITLVLFVGGLLVSTKIGGGAELHNMDAYLVTLAVIGVHFLAGRVAAENGKPVKSPAAPWPVITAALMLGCAFALQQVVRSNAYQAEGAARDLQTLQEVSSRAEGAGGETLFITERQLLTFGLIRGVRLVPDYEVATLMEMAMSGNQVYLEQFYEDLRTHRFSVIIARKQNTGLQEAGEEAFAEENNVWNELVARPLLCYYEPTLSLSHANVQVFKPRAGIPAGCP